MRRMLDPTKVGGIPSTIEFDKDGNRKVKKNLGVDGKLTLKSLVSESNPDGDITKELGGGGGGGDSGSARHCYSISVDGQFIYIVNTEKNYNFMIGKKNTVPDFISNPDYAELHAGGDKSYNDYRCYPAIGTYTGSDNVKRIVRYLSLYNDHEGVVDGVPMDSNITTGSVSINLSNITTRFSIVQLY